MFSQALKDKAAQALEVAGKAGLRIATVETVTSGLVAAAITSVSGASKVFERGFILYHDSAKASGLGLSDEIARRHGAVSAAITKGLAEGGLANSTAGVCVAVTGYAGPGGGNERDPVGSCYIAAASRGRETTVERCSFEGDRDAVRLAAVGAALDLIVRQLEDAARGTAARRS